MSKYVVVRSVTTLPLTHIEVNPVETAQFKRPTPPNLDSPARKALRYVPPALMTVKDAHATLVPYMVAVESNTRASEDVKVRFAVHAGLPTFDDTFFEWQQPFFEGKDGPRMKLQFSINDGTDTFHATMWTEVIVVVTKTTVAHYQSLWENCDDSSEQEAFLACLNYRETDKYTLAIAASIWARQNDSGVEYSWQFNVEHAEPWTT